MSRLFQTKVESVKGATVNTAAGALTKIGNLQITPGDYVQTDGQYVYGHQPYYGGGVFVTKKPKVLGDIPLLFYGGQKGYFSLEDKKIHVVKKKATLTTSYYSLVNSSNAWSIVDDEEITTSSYDADINDGGRVFVVENSFYEYRRNYSREQPIEGNGVFHHHVGKSTGHTPNGDDSATIDKDMLTYDYIVYGDIVWGETTETNPRNKKYIPTIANEMDSKIKSLTKGETSRKNITINYIHVDQNGEISYRAIYSSEAITTKEITMVFKRYDTFASLTYEQFSDGHDERHVEGEFSFAVENEIKSKKLICGYASVNVEKIKKTYKEGQKNYSVTFSNTDDAVNSNHIRDLGRTDELLTYVEWSGNSASFDSVPTINPGRVIGVSWEWAPAPIDGWPGHYTFSNVKAYKNWAYNFYPREAELLKEEKVWAKDTAIWEDVAKNIVEPGDEITNIYEIQDGFYWQDGKIYTADDSEIFNGAPQPYRAYGICEIGENEYLVIFSYTLVIIKDGVATAVQYADGERPYYSSQLYQKRLRKIDRQKLKEYLTTGEDLNY